MLKKEYNYALQADKAKKVHELLPLGTTGSENYNLSALNVTDKGLCGQFERLIKLSSVESGKLSSVFENYAIRRPKRA